jgi:hypothetical protein
MVTLKSASTVFRAQLVVPEQRQLFDYWVEKSGGRSMPDRSDISPCHFPRMLPGVSLIEVQPETLRLRIRLAGTRLREIYDREVTGCYIDDLDWGDKRDYWMAAFDRTVTERKPSQGVLRGPRLHKEHLVQHWLKLPLSMGADSVGMLLCFDSFQSAIDAGSTEIASALG